MHQQGTPANWAIHHDMATARFGGSQPNAAMCHRMAAFLPSLPAYAFWPGMVSLLNFRPWCKLCKAQRVPETLLCICLTHHTVLLFCHAV